MDVDTYEPIKFGKIDNEELEQLMLKTHYDYLAIEMIASYNMRVSDTVFMTCLQIGRYSMLKPTMKYDLVYRRDVKMTLVGYMKAKDSDISSYLAHRFARNPFKNGGKGLKKDPDFFYGFKADIWQAYAVGVTWLDITNNGKNHYIYIK